jgi:hypothetical protein
MHTRLSQLSVLLKKFDSWILRAALTVTVKVCLPVPSSARESEWA